MSLKSFLKIAPIFCLIFFANPTFSQAQTSAGTNLENSFLLTIIVGWLLIIGSVIGVWIVRKFLQKRQMPWWKRAIAYLLVVAGAFGIFVVFVLFQSQKSSIIYDAFSPKDIPSLKETQITYKNRVGKSLRVPAYQGQVQILVLPGTASTKVKSLIAEKGGQIISQIPAAGIYLAQIAAGGEATFIEELLQEPVVINASPNPIEVLYTSVQIDGWTESDISRGFTDAAGKVYYHMLPSEPGGKLGLTTDKSKAASHGDLVRYFLRGKKFEKSERDECFFTAKTCVPMGFFSVYPLAEIINAKKGDDYITFNLSFGPKEVDDQGNPLPPAVIQELEENSFRRYLNILQTGVEGVDKTILVRAAGNSGTDLTGVFRNLLPRTDAEQKAFDRLIVVGAVDANGKLTDYSSYSTNPKDIIYVPVKERTQTALYGGEVLVQGTSFAAPQITYLINQILEKYPQLAKEPAKLKSILFDPSVAKLKAVTDASGTSHPLRYYIEDPYDPKTIANALMVARKLLGLEPSASQPVKNTTKPEAAPKPASKPAPPAAKTGCTTPYDGLWNGTIEERGRRSIDHDPKTFEAIYHNYSLTFNISFTVSCVLDAYFGPTAIITSQKSPDPFFGCQSGCQLTSPRSSITPVYESETSSALHSLNIDINFPNRTHIGIFPIISEGSVITDREIKGSFNVSATGLSELSTGANWIGIDVVDSGSDALSNHARFYDFQCRSLGWPGCNKTAGATPDYIDFESFVLKKQ